MEVELYRIQPDATIPRHTHGGQEFTLVLAGGYTDETGSFGPGDLAVKGPEDTHQPVGDSGEICFALIVRDGAIRLTGAMGVVQRMLGRS
jgi:putative transcriptional regulator